MSYPGFENLLFVGFILLGLVILLAYARSTQPSGQVSDVNKDRPPDQTGIDHPVSGDHR
jgi:hypothetical protein